MPNLYEAQQHRKMGSGGNREGEIERRKGREKRVGRGEITEKMNGSKEGGESIVELYPVIFSPLPWLVITAEPLVVSIPVASHISPLQ